MFTSRDLAPCFSYLMEFSMPNFSHTDAHKISDLTVIHF